MLIHILILIILFLNPQHLQTAIPNLLLIKPALLQMLYELRVSPLESSQQIARQAIAETIVDGIERCVLTLVYLSFK